MGDDNTKGFIFVLVGPGGAGKNALMRKILQDDQQIQQLATATTRPRRYNEKHGREHLFLSHDDFNQMIESNALLEYQEVTPGKFYGIPRESVEDVINAGNDLIADIEVLGARILRETYGNQAVLIFITVPGDTIEDKLNVLQERMSNGDRNESQDIIQSRLDRARTLELPFAKEADVIIVNDDMQRATKELQNLIKNRREHSISTVEEL